MISLQHVSKAFGNQLIFRDLSLDIPDGARLCIVGGSGVGKSVLMKLVLGLETPDSGMIRIGGRPIHDFSREDWRKLLDDFGVVFQGSALFDSLNVLENVGIKLFENHSHDLATIKNRVVDSLEKVGLGAGILYKYPSELSGGMRKRVGISRAIIHHPKYLIYDEPSTGLDPISSDMIDHLIEELAAEPARTSIIVTHDMYTVKKVATQVAMIYDQHLLFNGNPDQFWASDQPEIRAFLRRSTEDTF